MTTTHIDYAIVPKPHPASYLAHKYWARKPHNVVAEYIARYSEPGEIVFDPFVGSGVTILEALKLGRKALAVDIDPTAIFIAANTCKPVPLGRLHAGFERVRAAAEQRIRALYGWKCKKCQKRVDVFQTIWQSQDGDHVPTMVKYRCRCCGDDRLILQRLSEGQRKAISRRKYATRLWYPKRRLITNTRINIHEGMTVTELFTLRNLSALSILRDAIMKVHDRDVRESLLFVFTSSLAQVAKIHSIDMRPGREWSSRGWTARGYWIPEGFIEENVWLAYKSRYQKVRAAKEEIRSAGFAYEEAKRFSDLKNGGTVFLLNQSATDLANIPDNSVDYIFTDPPYGDNIPYLELHQIWWSWLELEPDFEREIVISDSPERRKDFAEYERLISVAFSEIFRKLKPDRYMTLTFNNTRIDVWNAIIRAATVVGFDLEKIIYQPPAVKPSKASLHPYGSSFGDYYLRFRRPAQGKMVYGESDYLGKKYEAVVVSTAKSIIANRGEPVTFQHILNGIIPELDKNGVLLYASIDVKDVMQAHLNKEFILVDIRDEEGKVIGKKWWLAHPEELKINIVPLNERVEKAVLNFLRRKDRATFDDVEQEIFINFPNALTPEAYTIQQILHEYGRKLAGGYWALKRALRVSEDKHQDYINKLVLIGHELGFDIWTPDRHPITEDVALKKLDLAVPPQNLARIKKIDVLWLKKGRISASFEVENTTILSEAIVRASNIPYENERFIVLPEERMEFLRRRLREPLLSERVKKDRWNFIIYPAVDRLYRKVEAKRGIDASDFRAAVSNLDSPSNPQMSLFQQAAP
jgi:DNA modification methylase